MATFQNRPHDRPVPAPVLMSVHPDGVARVVFVSTDRDRNMTSPASVPAGVGTSIDVAAVVSAAPVGVPTCVAVTSGHAFVSPATDRVNPSASSAALEAVRRRTHTSLT